MKQLGAQDAQFLYMETEQNLANATMASIYAPPEANAHASIYDMVLAHVRERLHCSPIFKRKLVRVPLGLDYPYWVDDDYFDVESHLHLHRLASPGGHDQFNALFARIHSRPLDMSRPVWEMHVVEQLDNLSDAPKGSFAVIVKIHHAAVDGASAMKFFASLSDIDANGTPAVDISQHAAAAGAPPSRNDIIRRGVINNIRSPMRLGKTLLKALPSLVPAATATSDKADKTVVPRTRLNQFVSPQKSFNYAEFPLADLKRIASLVPEAKINDVVLAISGGALRAYLDHHNDLPSDDLVGWVPINARAPSGNVSDGNNITAMATRLATSLADPTARLAAITAHTQKSKAAQAGVSARLMTDVTQHLPGLTMALASRLILASDVTSKLCNIAISNVPGPQVPLYLSSAKCLRQHGMVPLSGGMGLFIVSLSYNGIMTFNVTSTQDVLPDLPFFMDCLQRAFNELLAASTHANTAAKTQG